nr:ATP-grasp fold amidoligase family protein [Roseibium denhamense]
MFARRAFWRLIKPLPDRLYIILKYLTILGRVPNLRSPARFTEKIQVRKLEDRDPRLGPLVDKHDAKRFVAEKIGAKYVIPSFWVGDDLSKIDWDTITFPVIVKPTHASALGRILNGIEDAKEFVEDNPVPVWLATDHASINREWAYSQIKPRVLIEKLLAHGEELPPTYRFYVFKGQVACVDVDFRQNGTDYTSFRRPDWSHIPVVDRDFYGKMIEDLPTPPLLGEMLDLAATLGADFDFVRVDLYASDDWIKFSELTFYPSGGFAVFDPPSFDEELGRQWTEALNEKKQPGTLPDPGETTALKKTG